MEDDNNSFKYEVISRKLNNTSTTISDYINSFVFQGHPDMASRIYYSKVLSDHMTNLFTGTKINIYIYDSKIPNAFTFPGAPEMKPVIHKILNFCSFFSVFGTLVSRWIIIGIDIISFKNYLLHTKGNNELLIYHPESDKFETSLEEVTAYISSSIIELFEDREITAILLHEIGHNTKILLTILTDAANLTVSGLTIGGIVNAFRMKKETAYEENNISHSLLYIILLAFTITFIVKYLRRRNEIHADEFAIKCGYGKESASAHEKIREYILKNSFFGNFKNLSFNFFDKILHSLLKLGAILVNAINVFHIGDYPSWGQRISTIKKKTEQYDASSNNIDRTKNIDSIAF